MKRYTFFTHWLPFLLGLLLIFLLSHQAKEQTENTSGLIITLLQSLGMSLEFIETYHIHFYVRKLAHFTEYFLLYLLCFRVVRLYQSIPPAIILSWAICVLYACTDEWHQSFVPGRGAAFRDVFIDASGAALAALCTAYFLTKNKNISLTFVSTDQSNNNYGM